MWYHLAPASLLPLREKVARPKAETDEGSVDLQPHRRNTPTTSTCGE